MSSFISGFTNYLPNIQSYIDWESPDKTASKVQDLTQTKKIIFLDDFTKEIDGLRLSIEKKLEGNQDIRNKLLSEKAILQKKIDEISKQVLKLDQNDKKLKAKLAALKKSEGIKKKPNHNFSAKV